MDERFARGIEEFNNQYFFEAHDTWEELWMDTAGEHRLFYQGLIQTAVGFYHLSNNNYKGACSQFNKALAKLDRYLPEYHGIKTQMLRDRVRGCLREAEELGSGRSATFDERMIPRVELIAASEST